MSLQEISAFGVKSDVPPKSVHPPNALIGRTTDCPRDRLKDRTEAMVGPQLRKMMKQLKPLVRPFHNSSLFEATRGALAGKIAYPPFTPKLRSQLVDFYAADVEQLGTLVQRDLAGWLAQTGESTSLD